LRKLLRGGAADYVTSFAGGVEALRYGLVAVLGAVFLYYGLKAVQLTGMSNRVWKRASEYNLILTERRRLAGSS